MRTIITVLACLMLSSCAASDRQQSADYDTFTITIDGVTVVCKPRSDNATCDWSEYDKMMSDKMIEEENAR